MIKISFKKDHSQMNTFFTLDIIDFSASMEALFPNRSLLARSFL